MVVLKNGWVMTSAALVCFFITESAFAKPVMPVEDRQTNLEQVIIEALQDEYRSQAGYDSILEKYDTIPLFREMKESEGNHIVLLRGLVDKYNISYHDDFVVPAATSPATLQEAYKAAVSGEIDNIVMFEKLAERDGLPPDVKAVLQQLGDESRNHLIEFRRMLNSGR
ncbi:ferritin-like domain-containing protein [Falsibacillus pallidus]|uniref:ferritin-like domain-containing protein n=1 Tax=Falsibacillus pallidus TaxID=493781 RepID=UPI003D97DD2C